MIAIQYQRSSVAQHPAQQLHTTPRGHAETASHCLMAEIPNINFIGFIGGRNNVPLRSLSQPNLWFFLDTLEQRFNSDAEL